MTEQFFIRYRNLLNHHLLRGLLNARLWSFPTEEKNGFYHKMTILPAGDASDQEETEIKVYRVYSRATVPSKDTYVLPHYRLVDASIMYRTQSEFWFTLDYTDFDLAYTPAGMETLFYVHLEQPAMTIKVPRKVLESGFELDGVVDNPPPHGIPTC